MRKSSALVTHCLQKAVPAQLVNRQHYWQTWFEYVYIYIYTHKCGSGIQVEFCRIAEAKACKLITCRKQFHLHWFPSTKSLSKRMNEVYLDHGPIKGVLHCNPFDAVLAAAYITRS